jgi:hypothetical protein
MTQPAHEWMLEIVTAAEELGYGIVGIANDEIRLTRPVGSNGYIDVTLRGQFVNGRLLRETLIAVKGENK